MKTTLQIEGMSCGHCVKSVTEALQNIAGVKKAKVNLKKKNAIVDHSDSVGIEAMEAAVTEAGFTLERL